MSVGARHTGMDCSLNGYDIQYFKHYITFIKIFSKIKKKRKEMQQVELFRAMTYTKAGKSTEVSYYSQKTRVEDK